MNKITLVLFLVNYMWTEISSVVEVVKKAKEDGKITEEEMSTILNTVGNAATSGISSYFQFKRVDVA